MVSISEEPRVKIILVDMDDTLCHYKEKHAYELQRNPAMPFPQSQYGFFLDLQIIENAWLGMNILRDMYDVWICTRCSAKNPMSYAEKAHWVKNNLGSEWVNRLIITPDKGLILGDILIDDTPWPNFKGEQILFHQETNNWDHIIKKLI